MKNKVKVNLNDSIHVKLTPTGIAMVEARNDRAFTKEIAEYKPKVEVDEDGYTEFQLWKFMMLFGPNIYAGMINMPYKMDVLIEVEEEESKMSVQTGYDDKRDELKNKLDECVTLAKELVAGERIPGYHEIRSTYAADVYIAVRNARNMV